MPLLPPNVAAVLATWIELVVPWFVGLDLLGRPFAVFLFIYNIIAFASFPGLWPHGFWRGLFSTSAFADHKIWGLMLMAVIAWGPGRLSLDALIGWAFRRWRGATLTTFEVGMFGWMALVYFVFFPGRPLHPDDPAFWLMMQIGMVLGFLTAFPVNAWLLNRGIKEPM